MKTVILAEKPAQGKAYAEALGTVKSYKTHVEVDTSILPGEVIVTWGIGHLISMAPMERYDEKYKKWAIADLPFLPNHYQYEIVDSTKTQFRAVKNLLEETDNIIIATDADREGENIAYSIINKCGEKVQRKPKKRLWANSMVAKDLVTAFKNLRDSSETYDFYIEAQTRQISDWLVGMNFTRYFTITAQNSGLEGVYSIGRVQTPCNSLVVLNDLEINQFKPETFYKFKGKATKNQIDLTFTTKIKYMDRTEIQKIFEENNFNQPLETTITKIEKKKSVKAAPKLLNLGGIQKIGNNKWKYGLDDTLATVQSLYTKGYLSYPRTECNHITTSEFDYLLENLELYQDVVDNRFEAAYTAPRKLHVDNEKVVEHYAIIPTTHVPKIETLTEEEQNIYLAVVNHTLQIFAADYEYEVTTAVIDHNDIEFKTSGKVIIQKGWKSLQKETEKEEAILPPLTEGEIISLVVSIDEGETKPPARLTEATLGAEGGLMEKLDIGRPATRASIIKVLIDRGFMSVKNTQLFPTEKGKLIYSMTKELLIGKPEMTAKWEEYLKLIGSGKGSQQTFIKNIEKFVHSTLTDLSENSFDKSEVNKIIEASKIGDCPKCKTGIITDKKKLFSCTNEACDFVLWKTIAGKTLSTSQAKELIQNKKTKLIKGFKGKKNTFDAKVILKEDGTTGFEFENKPKSISKKPYPKKIPRKV
ncbi:hypothetical protein CKN63_13410 [Carnobacterium divergens]|uniref:type IA DNA topoisomerase n=1 Tax=Carnobacterium divergens TaxID=2748 RepID=UPI0010728D85|nr:type IA DNA topoisomerase [Carnobacterium divergens]TFI60556.1 hypothetical protein CKN59_13345 [Carnobacterium divergens]TFI61645.1 hypothetical protein CKN76_12640 [Carnobacterium divergens]TFJ01031.1 hypothetical protein CKN75_12935 [Carnobacterium divergens]TFJ08951.1 hypothetical protein CKN71_12950 [Carnobacterium divergens]TFJ15660.1 hypothetical protein CKN63_13410 [Carnobacterium divergens]